MFEESSFLPKNVYVSEKDNEEKLEDNYNIDDVTSASESEKSESEKEEEEIQEEEGYEFYKEEENDSFSD